MKQLLLFYPKVVEKITIDMDLDMSKMRKKNRSFRRNKIKYKKIPLQICKTIGFSIEFSLKGNGMFRNSFLDCFKSLKRFIILQKGKAFAQ